MDGARGQELGVGAGAGARDRGERSRRHSAADGVGPGVYLGMLAATVLVGFGLTIVIKRVPRAYALSEDDDL